MKLRRELIKLLNSNNIEKCSNTPDYILADYLLRCLTAFNLSVRSREDHNFRKEHLSKDSAENVNQLTDNCERVKDEKF